MTQTFHAHLSLPGKTGGRVNTVAWRFPPLKLYGRIADESPMERRLHVRFPATGNVKLTDLATRESAAATLADISESGLSVLSLQSFKAEAVVKLEVADSALFGCVVYCNGEAPPFRIGIEVLRVLLGGTDLANLLNSLLVESLPATPGLVVSRADVSGSS